MKRTFRTLIALLTAAALLAAPAACGPDDFESRVPEQSSQTEQEDAAHEAPLRVFVELDMHQDVKANLENMLGWAAREGGPKDVELEFLPPITVYPFDSSARDAALSHLKTELMSGGGPDLLLCCCDNTRLEDVLFRFPEQAMERNLFLPLDNYIQNAKYMEWDKLIPIVMEAGRTDKGQLVMPLSWQMHVTFFRKSEVEHTPSQTMTYQESLEDPVLRMGAFEVTNPRVQLGRDGSQFLRLADYSTDTLAFTKEELMEVMESQRDLTQRLDAGEFDGAPACYQMALQPNYTRTADTSIEVYYSKECKAEFNGIDPLEVVTMVPTYTLEGGYGAMITSFGAVNANSKRPEDAFFLLDRLLGKEQQGSGLMGMLTGWLGMPVYAELGQESAPMDKDWYLGEENYKTYVELRDNIAAVRFGCRLDRYLWDLSWEARRGEGDLAQAVDKAYTQMTMELGES